MHLNFFLKSGFSFPFSQFSALLPTPGASNCSLKTVVWILIGYKSRPYLGLVVTETVLKPTATSPPSGSLGELVGVGDGFKAPVVSPTFCCFSGPTFVGERGTGEAGESRADRSSLENSLGEEGRRSLEYATGILIFPPWVCTRPLSQRSSQRPGIRPPPLTCPVLPAWTLGCPRSARTSSPEENLSGPGLRSRAAEAERTARRSDRLEAESPLPPCRGPGGGGPGLKTCTTAPPSPSQSPGATLQDPALQSKAPDSPSASKAHADSRAPGCSLQPPPGPPGPHAPHPGLSPHPSPGPRASRAPWAQRLLCARAARSSLAHPHPYPAPAGRWALPGLTCAGAVAAATPSPGAAAAQGEEGSTGLLAQRPPGAWCCRAADPPRDINNII